MPDNPNHYKAYKSRPFFKEEKETVTILFGGLTWKHERLIQGVFHNLHYRAEPLPNVVRANLDAGKELTDVGACCPTTFVTGNLISFLRSEIEKRGKTEVVQKYAYLTAGACGSCRFGQYHQSYTMALNMIGLTDFRIFLMAQDNLDQSSTSEKGLEITIPLTMGFVWAILCGDLLTDLEYSTRPYEISRHQTDQVLRESVEYLYEVFRRRPAHNKRWSTVTWHILTNYFTNALREVKRKWDGLQVDRLRVKPKVKITGEFWLQTHEGDGNYNIKRWLEEEGAEVVAPPIAIWLDYWMRFYVAEFEDRKKVDRYAPLKIQALRTLQWVFRSTYNRLRKSLGYLPNELPDQYEMKNLAAPFYHHRLSGGEGDMLIGKVLHARRHKTAHMICELNPYSCLPNTMSVGAMSQVLGKYPDLLYAPIEIKGDAEVHALSRCQMILTEAKRRAQQEFEGVLERTKMSQDRVRQYEAQHPHVTRISYRVPHNGYAGRAANYVFSLAKES